MFKKIAKFLVIAIAIMAIIGGCSSTTKTGESGSSDTKQEEKKTEDLTVEGEITSSIEYDTPKFNGTIKNNTDQELDYAEINITIYDKDGAQIGTALDNTNNLKAGGTWKFEAISLDNISEFDHFEYELSGF